MAKYVHHKNYHLNDFRAGSVVKCLPSLREARGSISGHTHAHLSRHTQNQQKKPQAGVVTSSHPITQEAEIGRPAWATAEEFGGYVIQ